jgi:hypothetical protein
VEHFAHSLRLQVACLPLPLWKYGTTVCVGDGGGFRIGIEFDWCVTVDL